MTDIRSATIRLRDEAWDSVRGSPAFAAFKALDDAVAAMGGKAMVSGEAQGEAGQRAFDDMAAVIRPRSEPSHGRVSQADAAAALLEERGEPTPGVKLLNGLPAKGASVSGANPIVNFTSSMSKSGRFRSVRRDGRYFWWFKDRPLPTDWNEPESEEFDRLLNSGSPKPSRQEGGDGHGPATT